MFLRVPGTFRSRAGRVAVAHDPERDLQVEQDRRIVEVDLRHPSDPVEPLAERVAVHVQQRRRLLAVPVRLEVALDGLEQPRGCSASWSRRRSSRSCQTSRAGSCASDHRYRWTPRSSNRVTAAGPCRAAPIRTACAASSNPSAWPWPPVRARDRPTATATLPRGRPLQPRRQLRVVADAQQRQRLQARARRRPSRGTPPATPSRTRASAASGSPAAGSASSTTATCCSDSSIRSRRARATSTASGSSPPASASRKSRSAFRPATWSISRPFRITWPAVAAIASEHVEQRGRGRLAAGADEHADQLAAGPDRRRDAGGGVRHAGQDVPVPRLREQPHPARERFEQRGVGDPLRAPPRPRHGADAEPAARVPRREQHRVGLEQRPGGLREAVQRPPPGCGRAEVVDGGGERPHGVELAAALRVQLRRLHRGGHERRERRHQREVVLGELVRRLGVQGDHSHQPLGRRDQRVREHRLEPLVVQLRHQQVARIVLRVLAHDRRRAVERGPPGQARADLQRVHADPLLVSLRARPHTQSLGVGLEQVDERAGRPRQLREQPHGLA